MKQPVLFLFIFVQFISCNSWQEKSSDNDVAWEQLHPGVWKNIIGTPSSLSLLRASGRIPRTATLDTMEASGFPLDADEIITYESGHKTYIRLPLDREEQIYGLGLQFKSIHRRGQILRLHVDHYGREDNGRTHAPVPFFVSSKGYGVLIDAARYIDMYIGTGVRKDSKNPPPLQDRNTDPGWSARPYSDNIEIMVPEEGVRIYVFEGPDMLKAIQRFNLFCGGGIIPPKWGLGFWQRTPTLFNQQDVSDEIRSFNERGFPLDVIGLEPGWHSRAYPCTFEWDPDRFPNPAGFTDTLLNEGIHLNLWMNPYLSPEGSLYNKMEPWSGTHTVWNGIVPDYTLEEPRNIMQRHLQKHQIDIGISGFKIDELDGYDVWLWPDAAQFPSGYDGEQLRQVYGLLTMDLIRDLYREKNQRTYGLVRAANAGATSMPFVIYNDYYSHPDFITALINSSFSGILWTPEVRSSGSAEEWLRRFQTVCFSPLAMINAWADGTKPWSFPEVEKEVRYFALLRMQLLPYLYSTFADYYFKGIPPFRAMVLETGFADTTDYEHTDSGSNPYKEAVLKEIKDQYMVGNDLLIAPLFEFQKERSVVLPQGNWFDFYTGEYAGNGELIFVQPGLDKIPVFVKDGGIIPMIEPRTRMPGPGEIADLNIRYYGNAPGSFWLYDDDGSSYDYESGIYSFTRLTVDQSKGMPEPSIEKAKEGPYHYQNESWIFMTPQNTR